MFPSKVPRVKKEIEDLTVKNKTNEFKVSQVNGELFHWKAVIKGPPDTVYDGGKFQIDILSPDEYPYQPPKMKFDTKIWHPNVSSVTGAICLDILKKEWSPALSIRTALLSIQALMCCPEPSNCRLTQRTLKTESWPKCTSKTKWCTTRPRATGSSSTRTPRLWKIAKYRS